MDSPDSSAFQPIFEETGLADNTMEIVEVQGRKIVVIKSLGKIYALDNTCPHLGGPLGRGMLQGDTVVCPLHHWSFNLVTGKCINGVSDERVATYEIKVENGKILVKLD